MSTELLMEILIASGETLYMVTLSGLIAVALGVPLGVILFAARHPHLWGKQGVYRYLGLFINAVRSMPFIILMIACIPATRWIIGTSIGTTAAVVPLSIAAIPFVARLLDNVLQEVSNGLIEAGLAMGATSWQVLRHIVLVEALPSLIQSIAMTLINLIAYSAMAGTIGGGGLGDLAIRYGYQRFDTKIMLITTMILILFVQVFQQLGDWLAKKFSH